MALVAGWIKLWNFSWNTRKQLLCASFRALVYSTVLEFLVLKNSSIQTLLLKPHFTKYTKPHFWKLKYLRFPPPPKNYHHFGHFFGTCLPVHEGLCESPKMVTSFWDTVEIFHKNEIWKVYSWVLMIQMRTSCKMLKLYGTILKVQHTEKVSNK